MKHFLIILLLLPALAFAQSKEYYKKWVEKWATPIIITDNDSIYLARFADSVVDYKPPYDTVKSYLLITGRYTRTEKGYCLTIKNKCTGIHLNKKSKRYSPMYIIWACRQNTPIYIIHHN